MTRPEVHACTRAILALPFLLGTLVAFVFLIGAIDALPLHGWWQSGISFGTGAAIPVAAWLGWRETVASVQREIDNLLPPTGGATERINP